MNNQQYNRLLSEGFSPKEAYIQSTNDPEATRQRLQKLTRDKEESMLSPERQQKVDDLKRKLRGE
jgi:hypothetical protein